MPLTGTVPFGQVGWTDDAIYAAIQSKPIAWGEATRHLSASAREFITGLLQKDPKDRMTVDAALAHPWVAGDGAAVVPLDKSLIQSLLAFNARNKFRRDAVHLVASEFTKEQVASLRSAFSSIDKDGSGTISPQELMAALRGAGFTNVGDVSALVDAIDADRNGKISWQEFVDAVSEHLIQKSQSNLW